MSTKSLLIKTTHSMYNVIFDEGKWILVKIGSIVPPIEDESKIETGETARGDGLRLSSSGIVLTNGDNKVAWTSELRKLEVFKILTQNSIYAIAPILDAGKFILIKIDGIENSDIPIYTTILGDYLRFKPNRVMDLYYGDEVAFSSSPITSLM